MAKNGDVAQGSRLLAIDWMRGLVMVLMTLDHSSDAFNAGRLFTDSVRLDRQPLPAADFFTRWVAHLCAPTFVFLAGTALALSVARRTRDGDTQAAIDKHIILRGLIITCLELWMSLVFGGPHTLVLQVLYAIGMGMVCMALLRRLSTGWLLGLGLLGWLASEPLAGLSAAVQGPLAIPGMLIFSGGRLGETHGFRAVVGYPLFPWLCTMVLGFAFGRWLLGLSAERRAGDAARLLLRCGIVLLAVYLALRGVNGLGNMGLYRHDDSLIQWLHVSKYPPSLTYWGLELGLAALVLALAFAVPLTWWPLVLLGQTAFFYYLLHAHLLEVASLALGMHKKAGLLVTYLAALAAVLVLLPLCSWYRGYKRAHPRGWPQYI
jgi:uncharacterized membrane protein